MTDLHLLTIDQFDKLLNETFTIRFLEGTEITALLVKAKAINGYSPLERKPFYLTFKTTQPVAFPQGIYRVTHAETGEMEVFIVPISSDKEGTEYQAIFS